MLSQKSIKSKFIIQLVIASATLIVIFSTILYNYIKASIYEDLNTELLKEAVLIKENLTKNVSNRGFTLFSNDDKTSLKDITVIIKIDKFFQPSFEQFSEKNQTFLKLYFPFDREKSSFLQIIKDISNTQKLLNKILRNILVINFIAMFFVIFYALILSQTLLFPINALANKLAKMNENFLNQIEVSKLPIEFAPLGNTINKLIERIQIFIKYQKELFIGIAHELKTPLAVMKTKNEVTLIKPREMEKYVEALRLNINSINEMNIMISNILEIGRQEGAQFELPQEIDIIEFLKEKINNFKLLAAQEKKEIICSLEPQTFMATIQPTLLLHIIQNFAQNAIKFTEEEGKIEIKSYPSKDGLTIEIIDNGIGIDESKDLFAPFKRFGKKSGAGLGLFLAKGAADAIGARIGLKNRTDCRGTIAFVELKSAAICKIIQN